MTNSRNPFYEGLELAPQRARSWWSAHRTEAITALSIFAFMGAVVLLALWSQGWLLEKLMPRMYP